MTDVDACVPDAHIVNRTRISCIYEITRKRDLPTDDGRADACVPDRQIHLPITIIGIETISQL